MRWTRAAHQTNALPADGEAMWSRCLDAGIKLREKFSHDDGDKKARSPGRAWNKPLKPAARGMPDVSGVTVVTNSYATFISHTRLRAHPASGIPCALQEGQRFVITRTRPASRGRR